MNAAASVPDVDGPGPVGLCTVELYLTIVRVGGVKTSEDLMAGERRRLRAISCDLRGGCAAVEKVHGVVREGCIRQPIAAVRRHSSFRNIMAEVATC